MLTGGVLTGGGAPCKVSGSSKMVRPREAYIIVGGPLEPRLSNRAMRTGFEETEGEAGSKAEPQWLETGEECGWPGVGGGLCPVTRTWP